MNLSQKTKRRTINLLISMAVTGGAVVAAGPAQAYNGGNAAAYADYWVGNFNGAYPRFSNDCTNFVSQAVHAGGYPFRNYNADPGGTESWWMYNISGGTWNWSVSWINAPTYYSFLALDYPGGIREGSAPGSSTNYYTPNSVVTGDVLFYDWGQGEGISHAAMQVGIGTDPNLYPNQVWYGNYVDEHTTNRGHAFWSLKPYNAFWATTTIYFMHIDAAN
jgi:hypothetical protein